MDVVEDVFEPVVRLRSQPVLAVSLLAGAVVIVLLTVFHFQLGWAVTIDSYDGFSGNVETVSMNWTGFTTRIGEHSPMVSFVSRDHLASVARALGDAHPGSWKRQPGGHCCDMPSFTVELKRGFEKYTARWDGAETAPPDAYAIALAVGL